MWKNIVAIHSILKKKIIIFKKLNINKIKSANIILKKINEKKGKVRKKNTLWITVVIHNALGVNKQ